jgi:Helicase conserved C-terminal domain
LTWPSGWVQIGRVDSLAVESLARWLGSLGVGELARVLDHRPEVCTAPVPRSLRELAERLQWPLGADAALQSLPLPATQLVEILLDTAPPTAEAVAERVGCSPDELAEALLPLAERALVWPDGEQWRVCSALQDAIAWPLGLGDPVAELTAGWRMDELRLLAESLGLDPTGQRSAVRAALAGWYADADRIRAVAATADKAARALLDELTWNGPEATVPGFALSAERIPGAVGWAIRHGLLMVNSYQGAHLPREVALALRGPDWRPSLDLTPPSVPLRPVDPAAVAREAAVAAAAALDGLAAILADCGGTPLALLKSGGVGVREVKRLARAAAVPAPDAPLWLELAVAAGLLVVTDEGAMPSAGYDDWYAAEPAARLVTVLRAWWSLGAQPTWEKRTPAPGVLVRDGSAALLVRARRALLTLACEGPDNAAVVDLDALRTALTWRLPVVMFGLQPLEEQVAALWREVGRLGLVAHDAATALGRALVADDVDALLTAARELLPPTTTTAIFQADLTAVVAGTPAAPLADLLDAAADREARGAASTWRFTADSVRRALDTGLDGEKLATDLADVAAGALPQALRYLIADAARRHGQVRVREVASVLHADDPALLAEIAASRALAPLGLALLAPTVLASAAPLAQTLAALRAAGYAPVGEDATGARVLDRLPQHRAEPPERKRAPVERLDPRDLAGRLLFGSGSSRSTQPDRRAARTTDADRSADRSASAGSATRLPAARRSMDDELDGADDAGTASAEAGGVGAVVVPLRRKDSPARDVEESAGREIARYTRQLPPAQRELLVRALEDDGQVRIGYVDSSGRYTRRVIDQLELDGDSIIAWCHLRDDERRFLLDRIDSVTPV